MTYIDNDGDTWNSARECATDSIAWVEKYWGGDADAAQVEARHVLDAYRAEVLREAADVAASYGEHSSPQMQSLVRKLRRMTNEKGGRVPTEEEQRDPNWCWMHNKVCTPQDHSEEEQNK